MTGNIGGVIYLFIYNTIKLIMPGMVQLLVFPNTFEVGQVRNFVLRALIHIQNISLLSQFRSRHFKILKPKMLNAGLSIYFFMPCDTLKMLSHV